MVTFIGMKKMSEVIYINPDAVAGQNHNQIATVNIDNEVDLHAGTERPEAGFGYQCSECFQLFRRRSGVVAMYLGLLLLMAGIIGQAAHYFIGATHHHSEIQAIQSNYQSLSEERNQFQRSYNIVTKEKDQLMTDFINLTEERNQLKNNFINLTNERDQLMIDFINLTEERDQQKTNIINLTKERDQQKTNFINLTKERDQLQSHYNTVAANRDELQNAVNCLKLKISAPCPQGWTTFGCSCYYVSSVKKTWEDSRKDCQSNGADLLIVNNKEEQDYISLFVQSIHSKVWIGLSDRQDEGKWKWVDGTDLELYKFWLWGEPNDAWGEENCAELRCNPDGWNDNDCSEELPWICEK